MNKRPRKRVTTTEIVSSTAFSLSKNPAMYDKVHIHEPNNEKKVIKKKESIAKDKQEKFDNVWAEMKKAANNL